MQFTPENLNQPENDEEEWSFTADLRQYFAEAEVDNNTIVDLLRVRGVILPTNEADPESSCTYIYFKSGEDAFNFIFRLNTIPEIRDYVPPIQPNPSEQHVMMSKVNWDRIRELIRENVSEEKRDAMGEIMVWDVEV